MLEKMFNFGIKLIFGMLFFLVITPVGLLLRMAGIDYLEGKANSEKISYWKKRR
jgi:hypothetical protein